MPILPDVLLRLGVERLILFHGAGGLDELTIAGPSRVIEVLDGTRREYQLDPTELGLDRAAPEALVGGGAAENAAIMRQVLDGERGPRRDVVVLNAASALVAAGVAGSWKEGVALAAETIDQGKGAEVLSRWVDFSRALDS
jgi:anthranilate phosphoribosyltransferase